MSHNILEVCVDSTASALAARAGGADRLELCADLAVGGTTPSAALVWQVKAETGLPVRALLRPRAGDFCYDRWELAQMEALAAELVAAGADGIVTGVLTPAGDLDLDAMQRICSSARKAARQAGRPVVVTLHRAFDVCRDATLCLEGACELGLATILTSGQAASAWEGRALPAAAGSRPHRDPGRRRRQRPEYPGPRPGDGGHRLPPLGQKADPQPDGFPAGGCADGPARL